MTTVYTGYIENQMRKAHKKKSNEIKVLREFLKEFNSIYADLRILKSMNYTELVLAIKETIKEI